MTNTEEKPEKDPKPTAQDDKSEKPTASIPKEPTAKTAKVIIAAEKPPSLKDLSLRPQRPLTKEQQDLAKAQAKGKEKMVGSSSKKITPGKGRFDAGEVPTMMFGQIALPMYRSTDPKKFRTVFKIDQQQECLVDNLWDTGNAKHKVATLNALCYYFNKIQGKPLGKNFSHYVVYQGRNQGVFTHWQSVLANITDFQGAVYRGFYSKKEALDTARDYLGPNFYVEDESATIYSAHQEVKPEIPSPFNVSYKERTTGVDNPSQLITEQNRYIETLQSTIKGLNEQKGQIAVEAQQLRDQVEKLEKKQEIYSPELLKEKLIALQNEILYASFTGMCKIIQELFVLKEISQEPTGLLLAVVDMSVVTEFQQQRVLALVV